MTHRLVPLPFRHCLASFFALLTMALGLALWSGSGTAADKAEKADNKSPAPPPRELEPLATFSKFPEWLTSVAFSPDGKTLAIGSFESLKFYDVESRKEQSAVKEPAGYIRSLAYAADGKHLAVGTYQAAVLWDIEPLREVQRLKGHKGYVNSVAFSPDGKSLATAGEEGLVKVWNLETREARLTLGQPGVGATSVAFSPDGRLLASGTGDVTRPSLPGEVRVWDLADGKELQKIAAHERPITGVAFSPDGKLVASCSLDETIKLWDAATGKETQTLEGHSRPVTSLAFLPDGKWLASSAGGRFNGMNDGRLWHLPTGQCRAILSGHTEPVNQLALAPGGKLLATCSNDKTARVWNIADVVAGDAPVVAAAKPETPAKPAAAETTVAAKTEAKSDAKDEQKPEVKTFRAGIIGLDTSHVIAFTKVLNDANAKDDVSGCRVVAAYPKGSPDIESSTSRVPGYIDEIKKLDVEIVDSIEALLEKVDVVLLETNDGRPHLEQVLPVLKAGKPVFIDKPIAGSLADAIAIFAASEQYKTPLFSCSSLRFTEGAQALRNGKIGDIMGCDTYSPCSLEATHPDLYWYGIHGVESLFTVMGTGCESVSRVSTPGLDVAAGTWKGGRIGTFRGIRTGSAGYGGTAFGTKGIEQVGSYGGYRPLVVEIVKFFRTRVVPVSKEETLEIYAFMEAADESKRQGGAPVTLESVMAKARDAAKKSQ